VYVTPFCVLDPLIPVAVQLPARQLSVDPATPDWVGEDDVDAVGDDDDPHPATASATANPIAQTSVVALIIAESPSWWLGGV
jgi:hypothetical protein